jgi:hypothetical protein
LRLIGLGGPHKPISVKLSAAASQEPAAKALRAVPANQWMKLVDDWSSTAVYTNFCMLLSSRSLNRAKCGNYSVRRREA